jgi:hypothetical protein
MPLDGDRAFHPPSPSACGNACWSRRCSFWDSRGGPIFTRLGGYFENVAVLAPAIAEHEAIRDAMAASATPRARAPRCTRTWTSRTTDSARAGAAQSLPDASILLPSTTTETSHDQQQQQERKRSPSNPGRLRLAAGALGARALRADQAQVGARLRDVRAVPQVLGVGRRRDQEAHQRPLRHPGVPGLHAGQGSRHQPGPDAGHGRHHPHRARASRGAPTRRWRSRTFRSSSATPSTS